jgi:hypothetical protein
MRRVTRIGYYASLQQQQAADGAFDALTVNTAGNLVLPRTWSCVHIQLMLQPVHSERHLAPTTASCMCIAHSRSIHNDNLAVWQQHAVVHVAPIRHGLTRPAAVKAAAAAVR